MKIRITNLTFDLEIDGTPPQPSLPPDPVLPPPQPDPPAPLPAGYDTDKSVGFWMLVNAMNAAGLTAIGVQNHGGHIIAALKALYPALDVYLSPSDAPVWPGFGSLDVTIDSGKGGWSFRVDHVTAWQPPEQRR
jgi:hypothetical protein